MTTTHTSSPNLDARYGRTTGRARRERWLGWGLAIAFVAVFLAWVVWTTFDGDGATIQSRDLGNTIVDDRTALLTFEVSMPPGETAGCAVEVQNEKHAIVGWQIVEVPASERYTQVIETEVRTTELGVVALIYQCWLT